MEESSSSSSSSSREYDVFLSFRGEDTRHGFISHLHAALWKKKIKTFIDYQLRKGDEISFALLKAIERSKISIVDFSKDYGGSTWCLEELVQILDCQKKYGQIVIPVFYGIDPSHVRKQSGTFGDAFARHQQVLGKNSEKLQRWRTALNAASSFAGWDSAHRIEYLFVNQIAKDVLNKLDYKRSLDEDGLVGVESRVNFIESVLCSSSNDVRALGIWGFGGIGKTTLARAVYNKIFNRFEGSHFLKDVGEKSKASGGLNQLRQELLASIFGNEYATIDPSSGGHKFPMKMLQRKKRLLIVFDDVTCSTQMEDLIGDFSNLGFGSRIIITSRDNQVFRNCGVDQIYQVDELFHDDPMKLFSRYAFKQNHPLAEYMELSNTVVTVAERVPLNLKVLGSCLFRLDNEIWVNLIHKLNRFIQYDIFEVLKISYDCLDDEEQVIFLEIACFLAGKDIVSVKNFLDNMGHYGELGLRVLQDKSLITVSNNTIEMHRLIQQMGKEIVRQESIDQCGKRSRLWCHEDIYSVLKRNTGTEAVQGISLDMSKIRDIHLNPHVFSRMCRLKFLKFYSSSNEKRNKVHGFLGLESSFSELREFSWYGYPFKSLPPKFHPKNLVTLDLPYSDLEQLPYIDQILDELKFINLSHSKHITIIPDLSLVQSVKSLVLEGCTSLLEIPSSIRCLNNLEILNLRDCKSLKSLPSCIHLRSLRILILSGCSNLNMFPEMSGNIQELYLGGTLIEELPSSIENQSRLVILDLENCSRLYSLPNGICKLKCLEDLNLTGCLNLDRLPDDLGNLKALKKLKVSGTGIREVPSSTVRLIKLGTLSFERCQGQESMGLLLPPLLGMDDLTNLVLSDCNIKELPESLGCLSSLRMLSLCRNNFESIPASIRDLSKLMMLNISYCESLRSLPILPRDLKLVAHNCTSLEAFSGLSVLFTHRPSYTLAVDFINCFKMQQNALRNLVDYALQKIQLIPTALSTELDEESDEVPSVLICYPGSEVPEWFTFQSTGSFVIVRHLPQGWFSENLVGFALCAVVAFQNHYNDERGLVLVCKCEFKSQDGNCHVAKGYFNGWGNGKYGTHFVGSDHVFLGCDFVMYPENFGRHYYTNEFSVQFYIEDYYCEHMDSCEVKKCGVRLIYGHEFGEPILSTSCDEDYFCKYLEEINGSFCGGMEKEILHGPHQRSCKLSASFEDRTQIKDEQMQTSETRLQERVGGGDIRIQALRTLENRGFVGGMGEQRLVELEDTVQVLAELVNNNKRREDDVSSILLRMLYHCGTALMFFVISFLISHGIN